MRGRAVLRRYELPILAGREPDATEAAASRGAERAVELSKAVDLFILRRTNALLSAHLPPKVIQIVCCPLSGMQVRTLWLQKAVVSVALRLRLRAMLARYRSACMTTS